LDRPGGQAAVSTNGRVKCALGILIPSARRSLVQDIPWPQPRIGVLQLKIGCAGSATAESGSGTWRGREAGRARLMVLHPRAVAPAAAVSPRLLWPTRGCPGLGLPAGSASVAFACWSAAVRSWVAGVTTERSPRCAASISGDRCRTERKEELLFTKNPRRSAAGGSVTP
jgi:hypothetical protein